VALFRTRSAAVYGIEAHVIDVEVDMYNGSARDFVTVGMPDTAVRESRERIKSALLNSGFGYPNKAVTVNLAPANVRKEGAGFDLPMAIGASLLVARPSRSRPTIDHYELPVSPSRQFCNYAHRFACFGNAPSELL
jgi:predicted ATPase with chaperone activity